LSAHIGPEEVATGEVSTGLGGDPLVATRHPIPWRDPAWLDEQALSAELDRVASICNGCRRCAGHCNAFPLLFQAFDRTPGVKATGLPRTVYWEVADNCYQCDRCFRSTCPYVPPHALEVDFPQLMLRTKAVRRRAAPVSRADRLLADTEAVGRIAGIPVVAPLVNVLGRTGVGRNLLDRTLGVHPRAPLPPLHADSARDRLQRRSRPAIEPLDTPETTGRVILFTTCHVNHSEPAIAEDLVAVFEYNGITVDLAAQERCCGMPQWEAGDLELIARYKETNIPELKGLVDRGFDVVAPLPSCVLMFKQYLPLLFPDDPEVLAVSRRVFDPFEYLWWRHRAGLLRTDFAASLGRVGYHQPCHLRAQGLGHGARDVLALVPGTQIELHEGCAGHGEAYGLRRRTREASEAIARPVVQKLQTSQPDHYGSDCPQAARQFKAALKGLGAPKHPLRLLRIAYGI
jgi:glycerol-3-phosphate dehydrogenase subunit C